MFTLHHQLGQARAGTLQLSHGTVRTPVFMPIATKGTVKYLGNDDFAAIGNEMLLANTYHLFLRPGVEILQAVGGIHTLMNWPKPVLTDSGGFQVFSLDRLRKITDDGVIFNSHIDGREINFTPEHSMDIQAAISSDIQMCFDYFPGFPATRADVERSVALTTAWAKRCKERFDDLPSISGPHPQPFSSSRRRVSSLNPLLNEERVASIGGRVRSNDGIEGGVERKRSLFAIVQGSSFPDLRQRSAKELIDIGFAGYAIGGLAVGEPPEVMYEMLEATLPELPEDKPRYLMGVGQPEQIAEAVKRGVDMFDCVLPTRNARHGQVYVHDPALEGKIVLPDLGVSYQKVIVKNAEFNRSIETLDPLCTCATCRSGYSRAYIRHLFTIDEALGKRLTTVHNLSFYMQLMLELQNTISQV